MIMVFDSDFHKLKLHYIEFIQEFLKKNEKKLARSFNFTFRYIYDVLSLHNSRFGDFVDRIIEFEIKDTTDNDRSASYIELHLKIDSEGRLRTKLLQKRRFQFSHCEHLHMEYISLTWYAIPEHVDPIRISLIESCC